MIDSTQGTHVRESDPRSAELEQRAAQVQQDLAATYASLTELAEAHAPCFESPARGAA